MRTRVGGTLAGLLLLCALAFGVLAMHHVGTPTAEHAPSAHAAAAMHHGGEGQPAPTDGDDQLVHLMHLCLAVLYVAIGAGLIASLLHRRFTVEMPLRRRPSSTPSPARPPPRAGRAVLHTVCVLRV